MLRKGIRLWMENQKRVLQSGCTLRPTRVCWKERKVLSTSVIFSINVGSADSGNGTKNNEWFKK